MKRSWMSWKHLSQFTSLRGEISANGTKTIVFIGVLLVPFASEFWHILCLSNSYKMTYRAKVINDMDKFIVIGDTIDLTNTYNI
jgi:hypothetical protein